jgi:hypothetical protein
LAITWRAEDMKKWLTFTAVLTLFASSVLAATQPGQRPDRKPSIIDRLLFGSTIEDEIVKQSNIVRAKEEKYNNTPADKKEGFLFFRHNVKRKTLNELNRQKEALKNLLASMPSDANATKSELIKENTGGPENANVEAIEVKFALENLRNVVLQGRKELLADPANLPKARKYYDAHAMCLSAIVEMNDEFIMNIDNKYLPAVKNLIYNFEDLLRETDQTLNSGLSSDELKQTVTEIRANQQKILRTLKDVQATRLPELKKWAQNNKPPLSERLTVARLASRTLHLTEQAQAIIKDFGSDYQDLQFTPPPLIVFEVDLSQFQINQ